MHTYLFRTDHANEKRGSRRDVHTPESRQYMLHRRKQLHLQFVKVFLKKFYLPRPVRDYSGRRLSSQFPVLQITRRAALVTLYYHVLSTSI